MSSPYPVLNDRSIDQWKVTELKEELRRRRLKTNGLKEELVRRLDDALRSEMEEAEKEEAEEEELGNGSCPNSDPDDRAEEEEPASLPAENAEPVEDKVGLGKPVPQPAKSNDQPVEEKSDNANNDGAMVDCLDSAVVDKENIDSTADGDQGMKDQDEKEVGIVTVDAEDNAEALQKSASDGQTGAGQLELDDCHTRNEGSSEDSKPSAQDVAHTASEPTNQVSEVTTDLGFQVMSESITTDCVSINEKNELKDNLNANNVNLELEVVKLEMVEPSSSGVLTIGGDQPLEDVKELVDYQASFEESGGDTCTTDMELCNKLEGVDGGSPEKLNLDRSSGDESIEEDVLVEGKQIESKGSFEVEERSESIKEDNVHEKKPIDAEVGEFSPQKMDMICEEETKTTAAAEKRKAEDKETVNKNEPKRRRWNLDPVKPTESHTSSLNTSTPKDAFQPALRRSFTRSDSNVSGDALKERIVPPSPKSATTSLRIDRFVRPFTLKAVQELLAKTGTVSDFWMDHIKTHCYVTYSSVEEAVATRNALYNLQWPTNGGRMLVAGFVEPQEVRTRVEGALQSPAPVTPSPTTASAPPFQRQPQAPPPARTNSLKQQLLPPPPPLPPPPALSDPPPARERLPLPPPPPPKPEPPVMTLDDLFKKTKATPRIYYLPLSEEQVATKLAAQAKQGSRK